MATKRRRAVACGELPRGEGLAGGEQKRTLSGRWSKVLARVLRLATVGMGTVTDIDPNERGCSSDGRAAGWQPAGRGFESRQLHSADAKRFARALHTPGHTSATPNLLPGLDYGEHSDASGQTRRRVRPRSLGVKDTRFSAWKRGFESRRGP